MTHPSQDQLDNGFDAWAQGSISSAPTYRTFFHATAADFDEFDPFQHFGTWEAANDRSSHRQSQHRMIEVWLAIRKPWKTIDNESANQVSQMAHHACQAGAIDQDALRRVIDRNEQDAATWEAAGESRNAIKWQVSMRPFADELKARGYDALSYENAVEHKGSTSYIPFKTDQIWWVESDNHQK